MDIFLGILVFLMLLWYGLKIFLRYGLPWLLARFVRNQQAKYGSSDGASGSHPQEGEVKVKKKTTQTNKDDKSFGEYVDFEDIKE